MILLDFKDAVREGNGETIATLHKVLRVIQNDDFLSEAEALQQLGKEVSGKMRWICYKKTITMTLRSPLNNGSQQDRQGN